MIQLQVETTNKLFVHLNSYQENFDPVFYKLQIMELFHICYLCDRLTNFLILN